MKIIIDSYIPYIKGTLDNVADVVYLSYKEITPDSVKNADALIIRTRTKCDAKLLDGSKVRFIASATIGYDHIDAKYCSDNNIRWTNAPGCNALSVVQYIASALSILANNNQAKLSNMTIGVVGVGAVGSKVAQLAEDFGMRVLLNDPPRARIEKGTSFASLAEICEEADIITFHTLLNVSGQDKTLHLADHHFFKSLKKKPVIINAARGEVIDTNALLSAMDAEMVADVVLDCWENEPDINRELLAKTTLATPHIAGYSADGKANAATHSVRAVSRFFSLGFDDWQVNDLPAPYGIDLSSVSNINRFFLDTYDIEKDSLQLKANPDAFEDLRSHYPFRREPKAYIGMMNDRLRNDFERKFKVFLK
ncbi:4-phosphoerythronate dehydrogenase [Paludibacter sp. 221]|uniref:4-phosphoerythronate dehydrogenase n=1 Tax=Paludibacter sp. 221 TaxID=2302939 RepID=UPI0013D1E54E|nr:4-phosphoerythronate dehydrogenase [Paludibacter sp. 221]NDV46853.1 4-phosphoerythronate dehydrogenase [Paludibacter sp. 221]